MQNPVVMSLTVIRVCAAEVVAIAAVVEGAPAAGVVVAAVAAVAVTVEAVVAAEVPAEVEVNLSRKCLNWILVQHLARKILLERKRKLLPQF